MKRILVAALTLLYLTTQGQQINWQNKDLQKDSVFGISTEKAYTELLKNKKSKTVIVAVIDGGIDTAHEDIKEVLWTNRIEAVDGKDNDKNGYIDDRHGWNFIGSKHGNVKYDNLELVRLIKRDKEFYDSLSLTIVPQQYRKGYQAYVKMKGTYSFKLFDAQHAKEQYGDIKFTIEKIVDKIGKGKPSSDDFKKYQPNDDKESAAIFWILQAFNSDSSYDSIKKEIDNGYDYFRILADYQLNINYDPRKIVGDNYNNSKQRFYGNNDVNGPDPKHGTHVAGIIGAARNNDIGIDGIDDNVRIMSIRIVPNGDERDKDVANAIRYAVDNGAKIINMSFGKYYSWNKRVVDDAVKYAMAKNTLIVHAAGNDHKNLDIPGNEVFPNKYYADKSGEAKSWIEVGASGEKDNSGLIAKFSNYGQTTVDVFAPGVHIYSTMPNSEYDYEDGTSVACPVVTGLATLIWEYYPKLTAVQVKDIITKSVIKREVLKDKCVSGGVVNAYEALKLAATY